MAYERVNGAWPETVPSLTAQEAITAAKRLWRKWLGRPFRGEIVVEGRRRARAVAVHGNVQMNIAPKNGWHGLIHSLSHRVHYRLHGLTKTYKDHDTRHHFIEREMVEYVVKSGWLDGKLHRPAKAKPPTDPKRERYERIVARIDSWQAKERRAKTALRKLAKQRTYYERQLNA